MIPCKLRKVVGGDNVKTDAVSGTTSGMPRIGERFLLLSPEVLDLDSAVRVISTSPVVSLTSSGAITLFKTENSTYELTVFDA